jgi:hypothetical protein
MNPVVSKINIKEESEVVLDRLGRGKDVLVFLLFRQSLQVYFL